MITLIPPLIIIPILVVSIWHLAPRLIRFPHIVRFEERYIIRRFDRDIGYNGEWVYYNPFHLSNEWCTLYFAHRYDTREEASKVVAEIKQKERKDNARPKLVSWW